MPPDKLPPPTWVATSQALERAASDLAIHPLLAVDTESNSLHAYREQVCLIQFSTAQTDYLIDPLVQDDLSPLAPIFADANIEKIFHAVEYDLICLKRDFAILVTNIFDTMQAARILGYKQVGLDAMLALKLGVKVNKRFQKADWARRPLTSDLLNYARLDTHYLIELRDILQAELQSRGRWELAREEFVRLAHGNNNIRSEIPAWQRIAGAQHFTDQQLAILQELCAWRENLAQQMNRPMFKVMDDKRLVGIARAAPQSMDELENMPLTSKQIVLYGHDLISAVATGRHTRPEKQPPAVRPGDAFLNRLDALGDWRKHTAEKMGVESDIVLPKAFMHAIADRNPRTLDELSVLMPESPWRLGQFGAELLQVLAETPAKRRQRKPFPSK